MPSPPGCRPPSCCGRCRRFATARGRRRDGPARARLQRLAAARARGLFRGTAAIEPAHGRPKPGSRPLGGRARYSAPGASRSPAHGPEAGLAPPRGGGRGTPGASAERGRRAASRCAEGGGRSRRTRCPPASLAGCAAPAIGGARPRVLVVGGGYGGATAAKYLRLLSRRRVEVVLVEPQPAFVSLPMSNLVLAGFHDMAEITRPCGASRLTASRGSATRSPRSTRRGAAPDWPPARRSATTSCCSRPASE